MQALMALAKLVLSIVLIEGDLHFASNSFFGICFPLFALLDFSN